MGTVFSLPVTGRQRHSADYFQRQQWQLVLLGDLTLIGNTLYGTTVGGGRAFGSVFSLPVTGGSGATELTYFGGSNGSGCLPGI